MIFIYWFGKKMYTIAERLSKDEIPRYLTAFVIALIATVVAVCWWWPLKGFLNIIVSFGVVAGVAAKLALLAFDAFVSHLCRRYYSLANSYDQYVGMRRCIRKEKSTHASFKNMHPDIYDFIEQDKGKRLCNVVFLRKF